MGDVMHDDMAPAAGDEPDASASTAQSDEQLLAQYGQDLADGIESAIPGWVAAAVALRLSPDDRADHQDAIAEAGRAAAADVGGRVRELLALDIDEQWTNPLSLLRSAIRYPNEILRSAGVAEANRDAQATRFQPDDVYDLAPASFADLAPELHDLGISWGAAKAHVHLRRRHHEQIG